MKIGIITFWQTKDNYGQVLQAFALQRVLIKMGHSPYLIRYTHSEIRFRNFKTRIKNAIKKLFYKESSLRNTSVINQDIRQFYSFKKNNLLMSNNLYHSIKELRINPPKADVYITGSDQVWAKSLAFEENKAFFLDFGPDKIKRISYAASFGSEQYEPKFYKKLKRNLKRFDAISVREKAGVDICSTINYKATHVLDPTLLLPGSYYKKLCHKDSNNPINYIYIYSINISNPEEICWEEIKCYSKTIGSKIKITPSSGYIPCLEIFDKDKCFKYDYSSIPNWLNNIATANLMITTSFHGIVFCILFHTPFVYIPLKGKFGKGNNRVLELLSDLNLSYRCLNDKSELLEIINSRIDWDQVDNTLLKLRHKSWDFLKYALNGQKRF